MYESLSRELRVIKIEFTDDIIHSCPSFHTFTDEGNQALQEFLAERNPKQQHSCTLESYLIKPIQRILKYPLLLQQLRNLTDSRCEEHLHLVGKYMQTHRMPNTWYWCG